MSLDREFACQANPEKHDSFYKIVVQITNCEMDVVVDHL